MSLAYQWLSPRYYYLCVDQESTNHKLPTTWEMIWFIRDLSAHRKKPAITTFQLRSANCAKQTTRARHLPPIQVERRANQARALPSSYVRTTLERELHVGRD